MKLNCRFKTYLLKYRTDKFVSKERFSRTSNGVVLATGTPLDDNRDSRGGTVWYIPASGRRVFLFK